MAEPHGVVADHPQRPDESSRHDPPDRSGDEVFNQQLSEKRARAVADYLVAAGLPAERFSAVGYGSALPVASNDTEDGKAQNRRIEFVVRQ